MKRTCLTTCVLGAVALTPALAMADDPAILYIPTEEVELNPDGSGVCSGAGSTNSAYGCTPNVDGPTPVMPFGGDMDALMSGLETALDPYDVHITNTRPPEYISYTLLLPEAPFTSPSLTCSFGGVNCGSRKRNGIVFMLESTQNCMMPDLVHSALYAFGRNSGLEGMVPPMDPMEPRDPMHFPPDYMMPVTTFLDQCFDREYQQNFGDDGMPTGPVNNLECAGIDHTGMCPDDANGDAGQNTHSDLLDYYGPRLEDVDAPVISNLMPEDGTVLMAEGGFAPLELTVDLADDEIVLGARWTIESEALIELGVEGGIYTACTNDVCDEVWADASPLKPTDSSWAFPGSLMVPPGEYVITFEAADYHGNVAEPQTVTVTIEGEPSDDTGSGGNQDTGDASATGSVFTTGEDESGDSNGSTAGQDDGGDGGCSCRTTPAPGGAALMMLGLMGLGVMRRRF